MLGHRRNPGELGLIERLQANVLLLAQLPLSSKGDDLVRVPFEGRNLLQAVSGTA